MENEQIETRINELEMNIKKNDLKWIKGRLQDQINHLAVLNVLFEKGVCTPEGYDKHYIEQGAKIGKFVKDGVKGFKEGVKGVF